MRTNSDEVHNQSRREIEGYERRQGTNTQRKYQENRIKKAEQRRWLHGLHHQMPDGIIEERGLVRTWVEIFDYRGDASFRGFIAEDDHGDKALFVFFDRNIVGKELKHGLITLLELCEDSNFACSHLLVAVDRSIGPPESERLNRDLGWVGFRPTTLQDWAGEGVISSEWLFLGMDV
ncbi:hypothetical protein EV356DRAFT_78390 [Viridothelium virens]|uniref:Ornithine decarboxylase antizyme n=1 Tax=Viridothelium virens TaxID=1048519 RepID=A0A6A6HFI2_VIRVR|nr:hypothetical protein EV356DRAFT_78390 [Viridothelium virens]